MELFNFSFLVFFGAFICVFEMRRGKVDYLIDFMRGISLIYFICYVLIPLFFVFIGFKSNINVKPYIRNIDTNNIQFLLGSALSWLSYFFLILGYKLFDKTRTLKSVSKKSNNFLVKITKKQLLFISISLLFFGTTVFIVYLDSLGGIERFFVLGSKVRTLGAVNFAKYGVLLRVAPIVIAPSILLFAICKKYEFKASVAVILNIITILSIVISLMLRFHQAGRLALIIYLTSFPLINLMYKRKITVISSLFISVVLVTIVLYGDSLFNFFSNYNLDSLIDNNPISTVISQFSFPFSNIYHALENVPEKASYRYFKDLYVGLIKLLPSSVLDINEPMSLSDINTSLLNNSSRGTVPVDIVTLGYYNLGFIGVILTSFVYGLFTRFLEALFSYKRDFVLIGIRVLFMLFWIFTVMYSDPTQIFGGGFYLIILGLSFISLFLFKNITKAVL